MQNFTKVGAWLSAGSLPVWGYYWRRSHHCQAPKVPVKSCRAGRCHLVAACNRLYYPRFLQSLIAHSHFHGHSMGVIATSRIQISDTITAAPDNNNLAQNEKQIFVVGASSAKLLIDYPRTRIGFHVPSSKYVPTFPEHLLLLLNLQERVRRQLLHQ